MKQTTLFLLERLTLGCNTLSHPTKRVKEEFMPLRSRCGRTSAGEKPSATLLIFYPWKQIEVTWGRI